MISLKSLLLENIVSPGISNTDIFNFYFLFTLASYHPESIQTDYGKYIQDVYLKNIKTKYINIFKGLVIRQLKKYYSLQRIDKNFDPSKIQDNASCFTLLELMRKTYRSDMNRHNDSWILICEFLSKLESSSTSKETYLMIDRLNACIHNTGTNILGKVSFELVDAYAKVHRSKSIKEYEQYVDKDLRQLLNQEALNEDDVYDLTHGKNKKIPDQRPADKHIVKKYNKSLTKDKEDDLKSKEFQFGPI